MFSKFSYNKKSMKQTALVSLVLILLMSIGQIYANSRRYEIPSTTTKPTQSAALAASESVQPIEQIVIHIVGEVNRPGVFTMDKGSRLYEAVELAGGFTEAANREGINLAQELLDGSQYIIPSESGELIINKNDGEQAVGYASENDGKVNINTADKQELQTLPGVGEVLAERIVAYRTEHGKFKNISELLNVDGIGEGKFQSIKDKVFVE